MTHPGQAPAESGDLSSTEDRIVHAALTLIATNGLGGLTMARIAATAHVARQTLYNHYPDVDGIVAAAIERHNRESLHLLESALRVVDEPADKLAQLVRHTVAVGAHGHHAAGIERGLSAEARATLAEYHNALDRHLREVLHEGQRRGVFRPDLTPDVDAVLIRHLLNGLAEKSAATPEQAATLTTTGTRTVLAAVSTHRPQRRAHGG
jgi:AcrR family transcriptional regulator